VVEVIMKWIAAALGGEDEQGAGKG
jgi:hypothetical protein